MVSLYRIVNVLNDCAEMEIKGKSTDTKPDELGGFKVSANSMFFEMDTGDFYYLKSTFQKGEETRDVRFEETSFTGEKDGNVYYHSFGRVEDLYDFEQPQLTVVFDGVEYEVTPSEGEVTLEMGDENLVETPFFIYWNLVNYGLHILVADGNEHTVEIVLVNKEADTPAVWKKFGSGGGEPEPTGQKLFDGSVTTVNEGDAIYHFDPPIDLNYSSLIVEFEGTKYTVSNTAVLEGSFEFGALYIDDVGWDWSEYPFNLYYGPFDDAIITETAGTYSLKIWANSDPVTDDDVMPSPDDPQ